MIMMIFFPRPPFQSHSTWEPVHSDKGLLEEKKCIYFVQLRSTKENAYYLRPAGDPVGKILDTMPFHGLGAILDWLAHFG